MPLHEYAHAWMATKLGDDTARLQGRLTLNPFAHLSFMGVLMLVIVGFGYAKPVPVNIMNFKDKKKGFAFTAIAGPVMNLILATIFIFIANAVYRFAGASETVDSIRSFIYTAGYINISLAVFNLLPIPPLDGSRIAALLVPDKYYYKILAYEQYIMIGLMILLFTGTLTSPLRFLVKIVANLLTRITYLPFRLF